MRENNAVFKTDELKLCDKEHEKKVKWLNDGWYLTLNISTPTPHPILSLSGVKDVHTRETTHTEVQREGGRKEWGTYIC